MVVVYTSAHFQPEKQYTLQVLLQVLWETDFRVVFTEENDANAPSKTLTRIILPNGACVEIEDHFFSLHSPERYCRPDHIPATALSVPHPLNDAETLTVLFGRPHYVFAEKKIVCGTDLLAGAFFMLSRWEEYASPVRDAHGRFPGSASLAVRAHFLDRPVVHEYAALLGDFFRHLGHPLPPVQRSFQVCFTHDVDHPLLWYRLSDRLRTLGGALLQRRSVQETAYWLQGPVWRAKDPYDTFDLMMEWSEKHGQAAHFNFMGRRSPDSDCYYSLDHPVVRRLLERIPARGHVIGFHPSYESFDAPERFQAELDSLQRLVRQSVRTGRQHYLRFAAPHTWQQWADAGMLWDSTLGYSDAEGFRCGMCIPFPVFNFLTRQALALWERPLVVMDVTLALYRRYTPAQGAERLERLRREVEKHRGQWVVLWHNSSWNGPFWEGWKNRLIESF
jgi:hypothetical protein